MPPGIPFFVLTRAERLKSFEWDMRRLLRRSANRLRSATSGSSLVRLTSFFVLVLGLAVPVHALDWFGHAYENHIEFGVMSRTFEPANGGAKLRRYVLLNARPAGPLVNPRPITLPESEVLLAVHDSLTKAGFTAATSADQAEIAIVVHYGNGEYPPPFDFMGIDPLVVPSFRWPSLLREYEQRFFRRNYSDAEDSGFVTRDRAEPADLINFIGIRAFDARDLRAHKRWTLRWETRITIDALNRPLEQHFRAMILVASDSFDRNNRNGSSRAAPIRNGIVELGELQVIDSAESEPSPSSSPSRTEPPPASSTSSPPPPVP